MKFISLHRPFLVSLGLSLISLSALDANFAKFPLDPQITKIQWDCASISPGVSAWAITEKGELFQGSVIVCDPSGYALLSVQGAEKRIPLSEIRQVSDEPFEPTRKKSVYGFISGISGIATGAELFDKFLGLHIVRQTNIAGENRWLVLDSQTDGRSFGGYLGLEGDIVYYVNKYYGLLGHLGLSYVAARQKFGDNDTPAVYHCSVSGDAGAHFDPNNCKRRSGELIAYKNIIENSARFGVRLLPIKGVFIDIFLAPVVYAFGAARYYYDGKMVASGSFAAAPGMADFGLPFTWGVGLVFPSRDRLYKLEILNNFGSAIKVQFGYGIRIY